MPNWLSPDTFEFFARYLLAGFILLSVRSWFVVSRRPRPSEMVLDSIIFSLVNQFLFQIGLWVIGLVGVELSVSAISQPLFFFEILGLPTLLGMSLGAALSNERFAGKLRRFAYPNGHPAERAYDFAFARQSQPCFVIVTYLDGTVVYGLFGQNSLAATDSNRSDIYLERLYSPDDDGTWQESQPRRSALIMLTDIRSIEFVPTGEEN